METPVNGARIREHLHYNLWKYILLAIVCCVGWNLFFTVTTPRAPADKKLDVYIYAYADGDKAGAWLEATRLKEFPDQMEFNAMVVSPDETYGLMTLSTHLFSGEGDLVVLPRSIFQEYAGQGFFRELDGVEGVEDVLTAAGVNLERGWRKNRDAGERHLYGIPVKPLTLLQGWINSSEDYYIGIRAADANPDNALALLKIMIREMLEVVGES